MPEAALGLEGRRRGPGQPEPDGRQSFLQGYYAMRSDAFKKTNSQYFELFRLLDLDLGSKFRSRAWRT